MIGHKYNSRDLAFMITQFLSNDAKRIYNSFFIVAV